MSGIRLCARSSLQDDDVIETVFNTYFFLYPFMLKSHQIHTMTDTEEGNGFGYTGPESLCAAHVILDRSHAGGTALKHLLTAEVLSLNGASQYDLVCDGNGLALFRDGVRVDALLPLMHWEVQYDPSTYGVRRVSNSSSEAFQASRFSVDCNYVGLTSGQKQFKLKVYVTTWTNPSVFWECRLFGAPWHADLKKFFRNLSGSHLVNWAKWCSTIANTMTMIRRMASSKDCTYLDCIPEHAISTAALMHIAIVRATVGRPIDQRQGMFVFLKDFLDQFLGRECIELKVDPDSALPFQLGSVPSSATLAICIDECDVYLGNLMAVMDVCEVALFQQCAQVVDPDASITDGIVHVATFLSALSEANHALYRQCVGQVAGHIDAILPDQWTANPLDIAENDSATPEKARRDVVLGDTLGMGRGCTGTESDKAHNTSQHIKSYQMFQPASKRARHLSPIDIENDMLLRYTQVNEYVWPSVQHLSLSSDGVRVASKDACYWLFSGKVGSEFKQAWALRVHQDSLEACFIT